MLIEALHVDVRFNDNAKDGLLYSENSKAYHGFNLSHKLRLFVFDGACSHFSVGFVTQNLQKGAIVIVPSMEIHFLSPREQTKFICIEIDESILSRETYFMLLRLQYMKQKHLDPINENSISYYKLASLYHSGFDTKTILQLLKNDILQRAKAQYGKQINLESNQTILALQFLHLVRSKSPFTVKETNVKPYAEHLGCCTKTLARVCHLVFQISPQDLLKHHLLIQSMILLRQKKTLNKVADTLGYSSLSAFVKFVKHQAGNTPYKIRKQIHNISIVQ